MTRYAYSKGIDVKRYLGAKQAQPSEIIISNFDLKKKALGVSTISQQSIFYLQPIIRFQLQANTKSRCESRSF